MPLWIERRGMAAVTAFERTADAADLWAEEAQRRSGERSVGLASAIIALFENAIARYDEEFLSWLAGLDPRSEAHDAARTHGGADHRLVEALVMASDAWEHAAREMPRDVLLGTAAAAFTAVARATSSADEPTLTRVWVWSCGAPVAPDPPFNREARGRLIRIESTGALAALRRASDVLLQEAREHPTNPVVGLVATIVGAVEHAIRREDRGTLGALREALAERTPAVDVLRARDLPTKVWQRDDPDGDAAILSSLHASDAWRKAAGVRWASQTTRAAAPVVAAINAAILKADVTTLGEFADWAHRYTENDVVLPTHSRAVRATMLVDRLSARLELHDRAEVVQGAPAHSWWPAYVATTVLDIGELLPECFPGGVDAGAVVRSMRERLEGPRERERLQAVRANEGTDKFVRSVAVSALKANKHTKRFAENLFTFERTRSQRRRSD